MLDATDEDWDTEFLALVLAVRVVDSVDEAIDHINDHGSGHSEAIVTADAAAARAFELGVDAACVYVNASTRFTDGGEFGMGAEIGNSTQKLHARGPIGLRELCAFKYVVARRRARAAVADGRPRRASSAGRSTRRTSATCCCAQEAREQLGLDRVLLVPVHTPPHKEAAGDPGPAVRVELCRAARRRRRALRGLDRRGRPRGPVLHRRYPAGAPCESTRVTS